MSSAQSSLPTPRRKIFEWAASWKPQKIESPVKVERESIHSNLPQKWLPPDNNNDNNKHDPDKNNKNPEVTTITTEQKQQQSTTSGGGVLAVKRDDSHDPIAILIKIIQHIWGDVFGFLSGLTGFLHH